MAPSPQSLSAQRVPVAVFDLDGTLIRGDSFVAFLLACLKRHPTRLMRCLHLPGAVFIHLVGWRDNTWLKTVFLRAIVGGLTRDDLDPLVVAFVNDLERTRIKARALETLEHHRAQGAHVVLASASPDLYVETIGAQLGFDAVISTRLAWAEDRCLGTLVDGNCHGAGKQRLIEERFGRVDYAYTDHDADLPMLLGATHRIAVDPNSRLRHLAERHEIEIVDWSD
jgi:HAD superfamily hydrolase (TIGR01490 family)